MSKKEFILGELFCGPGGMALGAKLAEPQFDDAETEFTIRHTWGVDIDEAAIRTFNENKLGVGVKADVRDFVENRGSRREEKISGYEPISALAFGFPCNDFSVVGKRKGLDGEFGELYKAGLKVLTEFEPEWFVAENVSGIESANSGEAFRRIRNELGMAGKHGYALTTHLYKFEDYGVPQFRRRYLIVGIRKDLGLKFKVPAPTHEGKPKTAEMALSEEVPDGVTNIEFTRQHERVVGRLKLTPPGENAWFLDKLMGLDAEGVRSRLRNVPWYENEIAPLRDAELTLAVKKACLNCTKARMSHIYRRLEPDKPSYTLTGSGGGGTHVYHWEEPRALTNRERARLQGFPDDFDFMGKKEQVRKQIGMAVSPPMARVIFEHVLKTFAGQYYESVLENG